MWVELDIDNFNLSWRKGAPSYLYFLLDKARLYCIEDDDDRYEEEYKAVRIGFKTNAREAIRFLDDHGYTLDFFAEIYDYFYPEIQATYREILEDQIAEDYWLENEDDLGQVNLNDTLLGYLRKFPDVGRKNELQDFSKFIGKFLEFERCEKQPIEIQIKPLALSDKRNYEINFGDYSHIKDEHGFNFEAMLDYAINKAMRLPFWITEIALFFGDKYYCMCPEFMDLLYLRLILNAVDSDKYVKLEFSTSMGKNEPFSPSVFFDEVSNELSRELLGKINFYNKGFQPLLVSEDKLRSRYIKSECRKLLQGFDGLDLYKKGLLLEQIVGLLFGDNGSVDIIEKRVSTGDEEIDLVIKNSIQSPFWLAFDSPLFFVECKNWSKPVGTKEIRDFEMKIINHSKLVKIGFFVSFNGFTAEVKSELRRASRGNYHIVLLSRFEIEDFLRTDKYFYYWLENEVVKNIY